MPDTAVLTRPAGAATAQSQQSAVAAAEAQQAAAMAATEQAALMALLSYVEGESLNQGRPQQLAEEAVRQILQAGRASLNLSDDQVAAAEEFLSDAITEMEPEYVHRFVDSLAEAIESRQQRARDDEENITEEPETPSPDEQRRWAANAGRTLATRLAAETSMELAPVVEAHAGIKLQKLWMSRADAKVRGSHRKLHGSAKPLDKPFWRELGTGKELGFPGDPSAPIEQTINCRCWLWFVEEDKASAAEDVFKLPDSEFEPMAASGHAHGSIWDLDEVAIGAEFDMAYGLVAATRGDDRTPSHGGTRERQFDEDKHKRGQGGRFARSEGSGSGPSRTNSRTRPFDYGEWVRKGGWDAVLKRYKRQGKKGKGGGGSGGGAGGGGGGGGTDTSAADALDAQIEAENAAMRESKQQAHEARRVARENLLAQRRSEDSAKFGRRLTEDEAMQQIRDDIADVERLRRAAQREADQLQTDIERSEDYIKQMRLHGELPSVIQAERQRLGLLNGKQKKATDLADSYSAKSAALGTSDVVRRLRDRVRFSRRAEDDQIKNDRASLDARIRQAIADQDDKIRESEQALRDRHKAMKKKK